MKTSTVRVLVVDDYEPWRHFVRSELQKGSLLQVVGEVSDGLEAVQRAQELQPDLILLDIGLPTLNGIEAARRIHELAPQSKILFVSANRSWDIVEEALHAGAAGYVIKAAAATELLPAVQAVFQGTQFVSPGLGRPKDTQNKSRHEVEFYLDDVSLVEGFAHLMEESLESGYEVAFFGTNLHHASLLDRFSSHGMDIDALVERGGYNFSDVVEALPALMGSNDLPDPDRCTRAFDDFIIKAKKKGKRVAVFGELSPALLAAGKIEAAIQLEHLTDEFARNHDVDVFCGYLLNFFPDAENNPTFRQICAEHSHVYKRESKPSRQRVPRISPN